MPLKSLFYGHYAVTSPENRTLVQNKLAQRTKAVKSCRYIKYLFYLFNDYKSLQIQIKHRLLTSVPVALRMLTCLDNMEMCTLASLINLSVSSTCYWIFQDFSP